MPECLSSLDSDVDLSEHMFKVCVKQPCANIVLLLLRTPSKLAHDSMPIKPFAEYFLSFGCRISLNIALISCMDNLQLFKVRFIPAVCKSLYKSHNQINS